MHVKKNRKDNYYIMGAGYVVLLLNTAWFCYGNYLYYNSSNGNDFCNPLVTDNVNKQINPI